MELICETLHPSRMSVTTP